jgi:hypothetical protein
MPRDTASSLRCAAAALAVLAGLARAAPVLADASIPVSELRARYDLYSESTYLSREDVLANSTRLRVEVARWSMGAPYLIGGDEAFNHSARLGDRGTLDTSSYTYVAPGLRLEWKPAQLFLESRFRKYGGPEASALQPALPTRDQRALLVLGLWRERDVLALRRSRVFGELYSETLYTSADANNVIHTTFLRPGLRYEPVERLYLDAFAKPFVSFDRGMHPYNNRAELEGGLRVVRLVGWLSVSLSGSYLVNRYFDYAATTEAVPNRHSGYRLLAVIGGAT